MVCTLTLPTFGRPSNELGFDGLFGTLQTEMLWCTRRGPKNFIMNSINILHVAPDTTPAETEITRMTDFLATTGFATRRERSPTHWVLADMLVLGMDERLSPNRRVVLDGLVRQAGLMPDLSVLVYGVGVDASPGHTDLHHPPHTNQQFGFDGVCMLHAHIRMSDDIRFRAGHLAYLTDRFEYLMGHVVILISHMLHEENNPSNLRFADKIKLFVRMLKSVGLDGPDIELFRCAINLIRDERNRMIHTGAHLSPPGEFPWGECQREHDWQECFVSMAKHHGRRDLIVGVDGSGDVALLRGGWWLFLMRLIHATYCWLLECRQMVNTARLVKR